MNILTPLKNLPLDAQFTFPLNTDVCHIVGFSIGGRICLFHNEVTGEFMRCASNLFVLPC